MGCINFQALQNDDGHRFSETLALTIMDSSSYTLAYPSRTYITIIEEYLTYQISVPSRVSVSEGNSAAICINAVFTSSTGKVVLGLATLDHSTSKV